MSATRLLPAWLIEVVQANERIAAREAENPQRKMREGSPAWDAIFDGERHVVTPPNIRNFQKQAHAAAWRRGLVLHTRQFGHQIRIQAERNEGVA